VGATNYSSSDNDIESPIQNHREQWTNDADQLKMSQITHQMHTKKMRNGTQRPRGNAFLVPSVALFKSKSSDDLSMLNHSRMRNQMDLVAEDEEDNDTTHKDESHTNPHSDQHGSVGGRALDDTSLVVPSVASSKKPHSLSTSPLHHSISSDNLHSKYHKKRKLEQLLGVNLDVIESDERRRRDPDEVQDSCIESAAGTVLQVPCALQSINSGEVSPSSVPTTATVSPSKIQQIEEKKYKQALKLYRLQRKRKRIELCTQAVIREFQREGHEPQFSRDCFLWHQTLQRPGDQRLSHILRRIFICLRYGGTLVRENRKKKEWFLWNKFPIASLLSHGSRVMIQLPKAKGREKDHSFWRWLLTGDPQGSTDAIMSTFWSSSRAFKENRIIFRRVAATHGITDSRQDKMDFDLPFQRSKIIHETKNRMGLKHSKLVGSKKYLFEQHRHWGMNVPLGGYGNKPYVFRRTEGEMPLEDYEQKEEIGCDGDHGHMYIHYMPPCNGGYGGLLIGVEGSEPNKESANGEKHTYKATSPLISPTWGLKWRKKGKSALGIGPDKYNSIFIDLASTGWKFLQSKEQDWSDNFIYEGCQDPFPVRKRITKGEFYAENVLAAYIL